MTRLLTTKEAAKILCCSDDNIRILVANGEIKAFQYGKRGHIKIDEQDLLEFKKKWTK